MTFAAVVLWIKTFLSSVPRAVYTHGLAFIVGVVLRGCLAVALVTLLAGQASAQPCPVNGSNCSCGCQQGGQCNCALTRVAPERLSRLDPQALAYRDLCNFAERNPQMTVVVYVKADAPPNDHAYVKGCRYDAGWPEITEPTMVFARFIDGVFVEQGRTLLMTRTYYLPPQRFGGNCSSGNCRGR